MIHLGKTVALTLAAWASLTLQASNPGGILSPIDDDPCSNAISIEEAMACYAGGGSTWGVDVDQCLADCATAKGKRDEDCRKNHPDPKSVEQAQCINGSKITYNACRKECLKHDN